MKEKLTGFGASGPENALEEIWRDAVSAAGPLCPARFELLQRTDTLADALSALRAHKAGCAVCAKEVE